MDASPPTDPPFNGCQDMTPSAHAGCAWHATLLCPHPPHLEQPWNTDRLYLVRPRSFEHCPTEIRVPKRRKTASWISFVGFSCVSSISLGTSTLRNSKRLVCCLFGIEVALPAQAWPSFEADNLAPSAQDSARTL